MTHASTEPTHGALAEAVDAVVSRGQHLVVSCREEAPLEHMGRLLLRRLRSKRGLLVEPVLPLSAPALLDRFNALVGALTLASAQATDGRAAGPSRVWVVHWSASRETADMQLLWRVVTGFPGAGIQLVVLTEPDGLLRLTGHAVPEGVYHWTLPAGRDDAEGLGAALAAAAPDVPASATASPQSSGVLQWLLRTPRAVARYLPPTMRRTALAATLGLSGVAAVAAAVVWNHQSRSVPAATAPVAVEWTAPAQSPAAAEAPRAALASTVSVSASASAPAPALVPVAAPSASPAVPRRPARRASAPALVELGQRTPSEGEGGAP